MCGIAGFVGMGDRADLEAMTQAMVHRGPDAQGLWSDEDLRIYLGHRRLSILDLSGGGQPMWTQDRRVGIVFNGEIYNHMELKEELSALGCRFQSSHSDTEVLLHGYRRWGKALVARLNGMWAFAIYDVEKRQVFVSRDRFGKKPLYYHHRSGLFAFASELSALVRHRHIDPVVSRLAVKKFFAYGFIPAPRTIFEQVHKLPAGCNLGFDLATGTISVERYWDFILEPWETPKDAEERWSEALRELLERAVARRLMADVPLGVLLSGGVDSSTVAVLAARLKTDDRLDTFSIGFQESSFDESRYARAVAEQIGARHHETILSADMARSRISEVLGRLDEPMGDQSLLPTFLVCQEARKKVVVALGGDGADELFAGYDPFLALRYARWYHSLVPRPLHRAIATLASHLTASHHYMSLNFKIKRALRGMDHAPALWNPLWLAPLDPKEMEAMFLEPFPLEEVYQEAIQAWEEGDADSLVDRTTRFFVRLYLQDGILTKVDRASMMNSLEVRSPFLDRDVVEFARHIPAAWRLKGGRTKYILKKAMEPLLPHDILYRRKQGFALPVGQWFQQGGIPSPQVSSGFPRDAFHQRLAHAHAEGREDHRMYLWNRLTLDSFLERYPGTGNNLVGAG